jgi:hypothetical protein
MPDKSVLKKEVKIQKKDEKTLLIGEQEFVIESDEITIGLGASIPRVRIKDLSEHVICVTVETEAETYIVSIEDEEADVVTIGIGYFGLPSEWMGKICLPEYVAMIQSSVAQHSEYAHRIEFDPDYFDGNWAQFYLAVKVTDEYLDDAIASGLALIGEILQPIRDVEQLIMKTIEAGESSGGETAKG